MVRLGQTCQSGGLSAVRSSVSAFLSLRLPHVQPMIMILTSDPTKLNQVCALWVQEGGVANVFICTEDPCLRWVTDLNFSWHRIDDGGVHREEGSLSSKFIFLPSSRTASSPRVYHIGQCQRVKTPHWSVGSYSNTRLGLKLKVNPCITHYTLSHLDQGQTESRCPHATDH